MAAESPMSVELNVDAIIDQLLSVRGARPGHQVALAESDIRGLCTRAREIFMSQPVLLELEAPIKICGQFGGCFASARAFEVRAFVLT
jgi:serine/threonine-protein phosphatase PP1 catalytic subunit